MKGLFRNKLILSLAELGQKIDTTLMFVLYMKLEVATSEFVLAYSLEVGKKC